MQRELSISSFDYHYLLCPSRRLRTSIKRGIGSILFASMAIYGVQNFQIDPASIVDSNVDSNNSQVAPRVDSNSKQGEGSSKQNQLQSALSDLAQLKSKLQTTEQENNELRELAESQRALNDELIQRVAGFQSGALYLKDKYADFAYAFNLENAEVVPLSQGISAGKVELAAMLTMSQQIPLGTVFDRPFRISSLYGARNIKGYPGASKNHKGIDFPVQVGTPLYAAADGYVEVLRPSKSQKGSGNFVRLQHAHGFESSFSHLSDFTVKTGDYVQKGDLIGYSGNTGFTTGPHLHYEIKFRGKHIDPKPLFSYKPGSDISSLRGTSRVDWDQLFQIYNDNALISAVIFRP